MYAFNSLEPGVLALSSLCKDLFKKFCRICTHFQVCGKSSLAQTAFINLSNSMRKIPRFIWLKTLLISYHTEADLSQSYEEIMLSESPRLSDTKIPASLEWFRVYASFMSVATYVFSFFLLLCLYLYANDFFFFLPLLHFYIFQPILIRCLGNMLFFSIWFEFIFF